MNCYQVSTKSEDAIERESKRGSGVVLAVKDSIKTKLFKFTSTSLELVCNVIKFCLIASWYVWYV